MGGHFHGAVHGERWVGSRHVTARVGPAKHEKAQRACQHARTSERDTQVLNALLFRQDATPTISAARERVNHGHGLVERHGVNCRLLLHLPLVTEHCPFAKADD